VEHAFGCGKIATINFLMEQGSMIRCQSLRRRMGLRDREIGQRRRGL